VIYRSRGGRFEIYNSFSTPQELQICYSSRAWVRSGADPLIFKDHIETDDDVVLYDPDLMIAALRLRFLTSKGFDTTAALADYNQALESAICADTDAPVLTLNVNDTYPLISTQFNAPDTGYGL
jgi:hypothetical protein